MYESKKRRLIVMKRKMKNRSHRCEISRPTSWYGHKYSRYKMCLSMIMLICIKQYLSNICSSNNEKVNQHWNWVEKTEILREIFGRQMFLQRQTNFSLINFLHWPGSPSSFCLIQSKYFSFANERYGITR